MSRIGVIGAVAPDYFAGNSGDELQRLDQAITQPCPAQACGRGRLIDSTAVLFIQALPRLDERAPDRIVRAAPAPGADREIVINPYDLGVAAILEKLS